MSKFPYGAVLKIQREYTWEDIFRLMKSMKEKGMNTVVVWPAVYWWEDKSLPNYPYQTGHEILKYAEKIGMKVVMELAGQITSLEYAPDFTMKDDYYAVKRDGSKEYCSRIYGYINFNHPEVKQLVEKQYTEQVQNYKGYSSLYGYDIWNETMFTSYDVYTLRLFRDWLKDKYKNIDNLNNVWDRTYFDWSQIEFTTWLWASVMPMVDYEQFHKDNIGIILNNMKNIIKAIDSEHPVIADNVFSMITMDEVYDRPQDDWNAAENVDILGVDIYPKFTSVPIPANLRWQTLVGVHSATKTGEFWISELQTHHSSMFGPLSYVYPYELRQWNWEAVSHGAKAIIHWKWEPFGKGVQTFGRGLITSKGEYTPRADETASIAKIISDNEKEFSEYTPEQPNVAMLYDRMNQDFVKAFIRPFESLTNIAVGGIPSRIYTDSLAGLYKCLWDENITAKYVSPKNIIEKAIDSYKVLFISTQVYISDELAEGIKHYVAQGGIVISDGKFGEIDATSYIHQQIPGGGLSQIAGFELLDMQPDNLKITAYQKVQDSEINLNGYFERRQVKLLNKDTEILAKYNDGEPAIVRLKYGKGEFIYISTYFWYGYLKGEVSAKQFIKFLDDNYSLCLFDVNNPSLKVCTLKGESGYLLFAFNYENEEITSDIVLGKDMSGKYQIVELYSQSAAPSEIVDGKLKLSATVAGLNTAIYKITKI